MFWYRHIVLALAISLLIGRTPTLVADQGNKIPDEARAILEKAEQFEVLSIDPSRAKETPKDGFHGWKVLGKTVVKDAEARKKVAAAFLKGVADGSEKDVARCFNPRHGIHATHDGKSADFVICFECGQVEVVVGDKKQNGAFITGSTQPTFDTVLKDAGIPLATKSKVIRKK